MRYYTQICQHGLNSEYETASILLYHATIWWNVPLDLSYRSDLLILLEEPRITFWNSGTELFSHCLSCIERALSLYFLYKANSCKDNSKVCKGRQTPFWFLKLLLCQACRITGWSPQLQMEYSNDPLYSVSGKRLLSIRHLNLFPGPFYFFGLSLYITIHHSSPYTYSFV